MVFCACVNAGLDVRLRANAVNLYFRGRSMARIVGRSRVPHQLETHPKYVVKERIGEFVGRRSGSYLVFDMSVGFAEVYAAELPALVLKAARHVGQEENVEMGLLRRNGGSADMCCFDRQVQVPGTRLRGALQWHFAHRRAPPSPRDGLLRTRTGGEPYQAEKGLVRLRPHHLPEPARRTVPPASRPVRDLGTLTVGAVCPGNPRPFNPPTPTSKTSDPDAPKAQNGRPCALEINRQKRRLVNRAG